MNLHSIHPSQAHLIIGLLLYLSPTLPLPAQIPYAPERHRILIETDAGGDPDDEQSLVRFLLYANEWDVEGIIANRPQARDGENRNAQRTGLGIVQALVNAYGQCFSNLVQHDARYPQPEILQARTIPGHNETSEGVDLILRAIDSPDPRPLWYSDWGSDNGSGTNNLRRALDKVRRERGDAGYRKFKNRLRLVSYDKFAEHTQMEPAWRLWVNTWQPEIQKRRWYHRFSALTSTAGGFDILRDVVRNHGPLGALYPVNTTHPQKEGDTMSFLYLVPTGMNDPNEPTWGSWAGRYGGRPEHFPRKAYYWANQEDAWQGVTNRDQTLSRWAEALQNDFRARLDWCVQPPNAANHPPQLVLNEVPGQSILHVRALPGQRLPLRTEGSKDPDGCQLEFEWFPYLEAGTYRGPVSLTSNRGSSTELVIPEDAGGETLHVLVAGTDSGQPPLTRYRRMVVEVANPKPAQLTVNPLLEPPPEFAGKLAEDLRSPLLFDDGSPVRTRKDWARRREQIERTWRTALGPWPEEIKKPRWEVLSESRRDNFGQKRIQLEIAPGQRQEGWLLTPDGPGRKPAVLVVYYEPETSIGLNREQPFRDFALQLTRRGFVTLSIGTPGGNAYQPALGNAQCQPLSFHAYVAANCWHLLAALPQVDRRRIGVTGHSYGGKWALFAAALFDRFAAVAISDPGIVFDETRPNVNYWEPWYLGLDPLKKRPRAGVPTTDNPTTGAYRQLRERGHDLHELHALIAPRPFFVSGGSEDPPERWTALNHTIQVNELLGVKARVGMSNRRDHTPDATSNEQLYSFFEHFLGPPAPSRRP
jgi:hypothetical protein